MTEPHPREGGRRLCHALGRGLGRPRAESPPRDMRGTWAQLTTLHRIAAEGPTTVSALANAEHVRPQSMAETVAALRRDGLVAAKPDPTDGRKTLMSITAAGRKLSSSIGPIREA